MDDAATETGLQMCSDVQSAVRPQLRTLIGPTRS